MSTCNTNTSQPSRWLDRGILAAVLLACGTALSVNVSDPDLWGHVQYGRDALAHGLPLTTTYSYVAAGYPWVNHEILAEIGLAFVNDHLGGVGLLTMKCLLGLLAVGLVVHNARRQGVGLITTCTMALLVAVSLGNHWSLRPQLASYVSFALLLALLAWCFEGWEGSWRLPLNFLERWRSPANAPAARARDSGSNLPGEADDAGLPYSIGRLKYLWLVPILMMLWTNSHGGFLAGYCVFVAYLGLRSVEAIANLGRRADGLVARFATMALAAGLATFINPYAHHFHTWLFHDLKVPRPEIIEWRAPDFTDPTTIPFILLCLSWFASLLFSKRSRDFTHNVVLGLLLWQSLTHHRHSAFFALAIGFWLPMHIESLLKRCRAVSGEGELTTNLSPRLRIAFGAVVAAACLLCGVRLVGRLGELKVERNAYPVAAFNYIAQHKLHGKMFATFNWAQYALGAFGTRTAGDEGIQVHIDGRCRTSYSQQMLDEHFDLILGEMPPSERYRDPNSGPFDATRVLRTATPDLVLLSRSQVPGVEAMNRERDRWVLLYQDEIAQLWGRTARYGDPRSPHYIPIQQRTIGDAPQQGYVRWPGFPAADQVQVTAGKPALVGQESRL
jgi:hypothetical protein